ncbi:MAG TPA: hypothetical protein PLM74_09795, partial [Bacillota bacterium]|nr:hypothetical protein [Bacillota bacterium]
MRRPIKITRRQALVETGTPEALDPREDTTAPHPLKLDAYARFDDVEEQVSLISTALGSPSDLAVRRISDGIVCLFLSPLVDQGAVRHSLVEPLSRAGWLELQEKGEAARVLPAAG